MKKLNAVTPMQSREIALTVEEKTKAVAFLANNTPYQNEKAAETRLLQLFDDKLDIKKTSVFREGGVKENITSIERPRGITSEEIDQARKSLKLSMLPGPSEIIVEALNVLASQAITYESDKKVMSAKCMSYCAELDSLPVDAVLEAIRSGWDDFPSLKKLKEKANSFASERSTMLRIVSKWQPWNREDEIESLKDRIQNAAFDARYYGVEGPNKFTKRAEAAKEAVYRLTKELEDISGEKVADVSDEDLQVTLDAFYSLFGGRNND